LEGLIFRVGRRGFVMIKGIDDIQKASKDSIEQAMKSVEAMNKGIQALAVETADYQKKSYENGAAALEKLMAAKSVENAVEIQNEYLKATYEGYVSELTKIGSMMTDFAKDAYRPFESVFGKLPK